MKKTYVWSKERGLRTLKEGISFEHYREKYPTAKKVKKPPTMNTLQKWVCDGVAKSIDGCRVEPNGTCIHGYPSWLLVTFVGDRK